MSLTSNPARPAPEAVLDTAHAVRQAARLRAYQDSWLIQDASNILGCLASGGTFAQAVRADTEELGLGSLHDARHPLVVLYLSKLCSLVPLKLDESEEFHIAATLVREVREGRLAIGSPEHHAALRAYYDEFGAIYDRRYRRTAG